MRQDLEQHAGNRIVHKKNGGTFGQQKLRGARRRKNS